MVTFDLALARRFDVPFVRGMKVRRISIAANTDSHATSDPGVYLGTDLDTRDAVVAWDGCFNTADEMDDIDHADIVLDYTDPGTLGHILAAVRVAWGDQYAGVCGHYWTWDVCLEDGMGDERAFSGPTEAHALAAAWEGRPRSMAPFCACGRQPNECDGSRAGCRRGAP